MNSVTITPAENGFVIVDGQRLLVASTLQEAFQLIITALQRDSLVFVVDPKSELAH